LKRPAGLNGLSPLNASQFISRRLKLDLRNESDVPIAGIRHWNRPNNAATGQVPARGCRMAYFQTKNPNLGKFWRVLEWKMLVYSKHCSEIANIESEMAKILMINKKQMQQNKFCIIKTKKETWQIH
jgi:hypothetical protein